MTTSPSSPAPAENQPPTAADRREWRRHLPALASAAAGINHASNAWDAVSDSFCDMDGWPVDEKGYADGKVKRDAEAWKHVEVFLDHGPKVLAAVRAATDSSDYAEGRSAKTCTGCAGPTPPWSRPVGSGTSGTRSWPSWTPRSRAP